jgi:myosin-9
LNLQRPGYHSDESAFIENAELVDIIAGLLSIKAQQLGQALTMRRTVLKHDVVVSRYSMAEAAQTRDAMAKCLYNALFHWIVLRINHSLVRKESAATAKNGLYIGILDIFGFEDVGAQVNYSIF